MDIKELRYQTGLTQKEFADTFSIPVSTLRKWEHGESTPAPYIVKLIADRLPVNKDYLTKIKDDKGNMFYYDKKAKCLMDSKGTKIRTYEDLDGVKKQNLPLYVSDLYESYYEIVDRFNRECEFDKTEDIIWR